MAEPDSYSEDGMNRILLSSGRRQSSRAEPAVKPNVVLVVSESFFDPTRLPGVSFSADPVPNFHTLAEAFPSGVFLSNTYAGGTGNVEMELFTGHPFRLPGGGGVPHRPGRYVGLPPCAFAGPGIRGGGV